MAAPGGLTELGSAGIVAWDKWVSKVLAAVDPPAALAPEAEAATELRIPDWPAVPARIRACLGRKRADRLFDAQNESGDVGRPRLQEEYAEWRLVRDKGEPIRFELTTELFDYWAVLARESPRTVLDVAAQFAGEAVSAQDLFGEHDPFDPASTPDERCEAIERALIGGSGLNPGPYNNGAKAITCLSRGDSSLGALANLVAAAAVPQLVIDAESGAPRFPSASEAIPGLRPHSAIDCRNSDPVVVERVMRLASEGRLLRFDDPVGVYIAGVQHHDLLTPEGKSVPASWFKLSRPEPSRSDGLPRSQRLEFEVPDPNLKLSELRSRRTGLPIRYGAQIAELVQLAVYIRASPTGAITVDPPRKPATSIPPCAEHRGCEDVRRIAAELEAGAA